MARGYRYAYPGEDPAQTTRVEEMKVKSLITRPLEGERVPVGRVRVQGFAWAGPSAGAAGTPKPATPARHFPDGAGRSIAERACLACHSAMLATQQRKDSLGWVKTVSQMEAWSAPLAPGVRDSLLRYLAHHFGGTRK
jgi:hypothetical protein